ncbi:MAG TPA: calcium/sodium antiporter, partial [Longimicrobiales bacterium]|nr:calcium/sodium antiporter [Longimicrobiales bacterium]
MILEVGRIVLGLILLVVGADALVRGAVALARRAGISSLLIGLTVVAFGTSTPEVAVSVESALMGRGGVALGNVVGSNVFNILVVLGLSAVIAPLVVQSQLVRRDVPLMVLASLAPVLLGLDGALGRQDGVILLVGLGGYLAILGLLARRQRSDHRNGEVEHAEDAGGTTEAGGPSLPVALTLGVGGLILLSVGADQLVVGAVSLAGRLGVSELVVGLTVVAVGTSLPELATSVAASLRGQRDLAVGNVVGSNIFNALGVLGAGAAVSGSIPIPRGMYALDFPVMVAVAVICLPVFLTGANISRREGAVFLLYYVAYMTYLVLHATDHALYD